MGLHAVWRNFECLVDFRYLCGALLRCVDAIQNERQRLLHFLCVFYTHLLTNHTHKKENTHKYTVCVNIMNKTFDLKWICVCFGVVVMQSFSGSGDT